jgi:hypothetical protein
MSFKALAWAVDQKTVHAADKLILMGLADRHNTEEDVAYPSLKWLAEFSSLDRKTIISGLTRLEADKLIADSGHRYGATKQIKGYRLSLENSMGKTEPFQKRNRSENGGKEYRKRNTEPIRNQHRNKKSTAREILEDWKPFPTLGSKTSEFMKSWPTGFEESEVERFIAYHLSHKTKSENFNRQWATWALGPYCREALRKWNDERSGEGGPFGTNSLANLAARRAGGNGSATEQRRTNRLL